MDKHERLSTLLEIVGTRDKVDVEVMATELDVSAATVRRDLDHLAEQQLLTRTRGGAVANNVAYDLPMRHKSARHAPEKQRISAHAARMVGAGMTVGFNGGTTTTEIARGLATRTDLAEGGDGCVTVVTNALNIAGELAVRPHVKIVVTGGVARQQSFELAGPLATRVIDELNLDVLFLGVDAIDADRGAYAQHEGEADINRLMTRRADRVVVVADSSKVGHAAFARICTADALDELVTDIGAPETVLAGFRELGVAVTTV